MAAERKFVAENVRRVLLKEYLMKDILLDEREYALHIVGRVRNLRTGKK